MSVAVVSKAFVKRKDPCAELRYAFERMEWLERQQEHSWRPLWIVLFDMTVKEYKEALRDADRTARWGPLPDIGSEIVIFEWMDGKGKFESWSHVCHRIKADIIEHDNERAVGNWKSFLQSYAASPRDASFPPADDLYK